MSTRGAATKLLFQETFQGETNIRWIEFLLVVIFRFAMSAEAQYRAGLQGVIGDPQGSVISDATVTLTN